MRDVRYFGRLANPAHYGRGFGVWSLIIRVLDALRLWCERRVVLAILGIELRKAGFNASQVKALLRQAERDPLFDPARYHDVLKRAKRTVLRDLVDAVRDERPRAARYAEGRKNKEEEEGPAVKPMPFEEMAPTIAGYQRKQDRSVRYAHGRRSKVICLDGDDLFVPARRKEST